MSDLLSARAGEVADGLFVLLRAVLRAGLPVAVPPAVVELAQELQAISESGNVGSGAASMVRMESPDQAGDAVGLTGRRVRQLCASGLVAHRIVGAGRYLVDVDDLQRHLRGESDE